MRIYRNPRFNKKSEYLAQMLNVLRQGLRINNYVVDICSGKGEIAEKSINLPLYIGRGILITYYRNIECLLPSVTDDSEFIAIPIMYSLLIEEAGAVNDADISTTLDRRYQV